MDLAIQDCFQVLMRVRPSAADRPEDAEQPLGCYPSYEEAHSTCQQMRRQGHDCVVRFLGEAGGGD